MAPRIGCPVLFCLCDGDSLAPAKRSATLAAKAPRAEIKRYPVGHFEIYIGEPFERAVADQTEFLVRHLGGRGRSAQPNGNRLEHARDPAHH
jgi:pimeloyl-ACP methyl ester carboxylesterase